MAAKKSPSSPAKPRRKRPRQAPFRDVAVVVGRTDDLRGFQILRKRADQESFEIGTVRPLEPGKPIDGQIVGLKPRKDFAFLYDVNVEFDPHADAEPSPAPRATDGPALVATEEYRRGWDAIWGRKRRLAGSQLN